MRSHASLFALLFAVGSFALPFTAHAGIPFFDPIIPEAYNVCSAGWGLLITVINNIIELLLTLAIVFVAPLSIAYAGFLYVVNPVNSGGMEKAKGILTNTIVGIVIALAGWLIVDAIMAVLYNGKFGTWTNLIQMNGVPCIEQTGSLTNGQTGIPNPTAGAVTLRSPHPGKNGVGGGSGSACDPARVQAAAATGGYTLTNAQANTFACIAVPESNCGTANLNYNWNGAKSIPASTAAGAFQVLLATHHDCYEKSVCQAAAGVSGPLNCQRGFETKLLPSGAPNPNWGKPIQTQAAAALVQNCVTAASNLNCSASAAACVLQQAGGNFRDWQADVNSAVQTGCINSSGG